MNRRAQINSQPGRMLMPAPIRQLVLVMAVVLISGCASQQNQDPDRVSNKRLAAESNTSLGLEYMNRGQYEVALGKLKKAVREDPDLCTGAYGDGGTL